MVDYNNGTLDFTCDCCEGNIEVGYRVDDEFYCEDCMLEHLKEDVCEQIFVNEAGEEVDEDDPDAEMAYRFEGVVYKDDEDGIFNNILLDAYADDLVTIEELEEDCENGIIEDSAEDDDDYDEDYDDSDEYFDEDEDYDEDGDDI